MVKSLEPNTTHGSELTQLFCFDFDRPNCLGPDLAARVLMSYAEEFVTKYEMERKRRNPFLRWAAFIHFIDTHEDTMILSSMLDAEMSSFLERLADQEAFNNTLVVLTSDHGLHYGPYFQSRSGRREATEPVLYILAPSNIQTSEAMATFNRNAGLWTTPFDVHETLLSLSIPTKENGAFRKGISLFKPFPEERKYCTGVAEIPMEYCVLKTGQISRENASTPPCTKMARPPNILSFYRDLPTSKRSRFSIDCKSMENKTASQASFNTACQCATSHRDWHICGEHPWGPEEVNSTRNPQEYFALVQCHGQKMAIDTRVVPNTDAQRQFQRRELAFPKITAERPPNVLFIELGSAVTASADRHLPKTRAFLKQHKLRHISDGQVECNKSICAPEFNLFSLNGPNAIDNKVRTVSNGLSQFHHLAKSFFFSRYRWRL